MERGVGHVDAARNWSGASKSRVMESPATVMATLSGKVPRSPNCRTRRRSDSAVGNGGDAGAHPAFGIVQQRIARRQHHVGAVLGAQRLETLHATRLAAICARRSDRRSCGTWQLRG